MSTWYLVADIGGTNARFSALKPGQLESELQFFHSVDEYPNFENLLEIIINEIGQVTGWENPPYKAWLVFELSQKILSKFVILSSKNYFT